MMGNVEIRNRKGTDSGRGRALRWSAGAVMLAVTPKCAICVFGYLALAVGGAQVEICGAGPQRTELSQLLAPVLAVGTIGTIGGTKPLSRPGPGFPK
jgi:hypothetical protein